MRHPQSGCKRDTSQDLLLIKTAKRKETLGNFPHGWHQFGSPAVNGEILISVWPYIGAPNLMIREPSSQDSKQDEQKGNFCPPGRLKDLQPVVWTVYSGQCEIFIFSLPSITDWDLWESRLCKNFYTSLKPASFPDPIWAPGVFEVESVAPGLPDSGKFS